MHERLVGEGERVMLPPSRAGPQSPASSRGAYRPAACCCCCCCGCDCCGWCWRRCWSCSSCCWNCCWVNMAEEAPRSCADPETKREQREARWWPGGQGGKAGLGWAAACSSAPQQKPCRASCTAAAAESIHSCRSRGLSALPPGVSPGDHEIPGGGLCALHRGVPSHPWNLRRANHRTHKHTRAHALSLQSSLGIASPFPKSGVLFLSISGCCFF